jgi:WD40 repeat protein
LHQLCKEGPDAVQGPTDDPSCVGIAPDGRTLAWARRDEVTLGAGSTGKDPAVLTGHDGLITALAFSPDGRYLAAGTEGARVRVWPLLSGPSRTVLVRLRGPGRPVRALAFTGDGKTLAVAAGGTIQLCNPATGSEGPVLARYAGANVTCLAFSPDGRWLAAAAGNDSLLLGPGQRGAFRILSENKGKVSCLAFTADGTLLAAGTEDGAIKLWETATAKQVCTLPGHAAGVASVAFAPDGKLLASGGVKGDLALWEVATRKPWLAVRGRHRSPVVALRFTGDGKRLVSSDRAGGTLFWGSPPSSP